MSDKQNLASGHPTDRKKREKWDHINHLLEIYSNICFPFIWFTSQGLVLEFRCEQFLCAKEKLGQTVSFNHFLSKSFVSSPFLFVFKGYSAAQ